VRALSFVRVADCVQPGAEPAGKATLSHREKHLCAAFIASVEKVIFSTPADIGRRLVACGFAVKLLCIFLSDKRY